MRRVLVSALAIALLGWSHVAWAVTCPGPNQKTLVVGTVQTANATTTADTGARQITTSGHDVVATLVACGGTACVATLYDSDSGLGGDTNTDAKVLLEPGAPANTSTYTPYDPPVTFTTGISFKDDSNVNAIIVYECRQP